MRVARRLVLAGAVAWASGCALGAGRTNATMSSRAGVTRAGAVVPSALGARRASAISASTVALTADEGAALALDPDNGTLSVLDPVRWEVRSRTRVGTEPVALLVRADGTVLVIDRAEDTLSEYALSDGARPAQLVRRVRVAAEPVALAYSPDHRAVFVVSAAAAALSVLDAESLRIDAVVPLAREPRGLAVDARHERVYVGHEVGGIVSVVRIPTYSVATLRLPLGPIPEGAPVPADVARRSPAPPPLRRIAGRNAVDPLVLRPRDTAVMARALALSPGDDKLYVAYTVETTNPESFDLSFDTYYGGVGSEGVAMPATTVAVLDLATGRWDSPGALSDAEFLRAPPPLQDPTWIGFRAHDARLLMTARGRSTLGELDPGAPDPARVGRALTLLVNGCAGPEGAATMRDGRTLVLCRFSHALHVIDAAPEDPTRAVALGEETLDAEAAWGRRLYHRADDHGISRFGFACASCHPEGRDDGVVWATVRGPMQTPWLAGRIADTAPYGWDGVHADLEANVRATLGRIGGDGSLRERDVRALAAYMLRGMHAPRALDQGTRAHAGEAVFALAGCAECHDPARGFTDGLLHDVGSGGMSTARPGFDTPSLRFVGLTPPYFHDGRYATLEDWLAGNDDHMGRTRALDGAQRVMLLGYLRSL